MPSDTNQILYGGQTIPFDSKQALYGSQNLYSDSNNTLCVGPTMPFDTVQALHRSEKTIEEPTFCGKQATPSDGNPILHGDQTTHFSYHTFYEGQPMNPSTQVSYTWAQIIGFQTLCGIQKQSPILNRPSRDTI